MNFRWPVRKSTSQRSTQHLKGLQTRQRGQRETDPESFETQMNMSGELMLVYNTLWCLAIWLNIMLDVYRECEFMKMALIGSS